MSLLCLHNLSETCPVKLCDASCKDFPEEAPSIHILYKALHHLDRVDSWKIALFLKDAEEEKKREREDKES